MRRALITGITGQDGSYLAEQLVAEGTQVVGMVRDGDPAISDLEALVPDAELVTGDLQDRASLDRVVDAARPDEVYHLAAFSEPGRSWQEPELTADVTGLGALRLLEAVRAHAPAARFCQASSSEVFGDADADPVDEDTPHRPRSPYGAAKAFAHASVVAYRHGHGLFACNAVLFNHESARRPETFVTRKITKAVAAISRGEQEQLTLGNLDAQRDWGHAADYVDAMVRMLRHDEPDDYVVATGELHSLRDLLDLAFAHVGIADWSGHVTQDPALFRPVESRPLRGAATKARDVLGWRPTRTLAEVVAEMVDHDLSQPSLA